MPTPRFFVPDAQRIIELHAHALSRFTWPDTDTADDAPQVFEEMGLKVDVRAAKQLCDRLTALTETQSPSLEALLASMAVYTARAGVLRLRSELGTRRLGAYAAMMLVGKLARRCGYKVEELEGVFNILTSQRPSQAQISARAWLGEHLTPDNDRDPRYLVLTPLTQASPDEQDACLQVADALEERKETDGLIFDVPGRRLPVAGTTGWPNDIMFGVERQHILGADFVLIVAGKLQSYGAGQSQSWAEGNVAPVQVVSSHTSRALGTGYWGTAAEPWVSADVAAASAIEAIAHHWDSIKAHAQESASIRQAWTRHVLLTAPAFLHTSVSASLPVRRIGALASDPFEVISLTGRELVRLRNADPAGFDASIGAMYIELGLHTGDTIEDRRPKTDSYDSDPANDAVAYRSEVLTVEDILRARPMRKPEESTLREFCIDNDVSALELNVLLAFVDNQYEPEMAYRSDISPDDLTFWLATARNVRGGARPGEQQ